MSRHEPRKFVLILVVAFVLRMATAFYLGNAVSGLSGAHDEISYSMLGQRFASGHGLTFPQTWFPWHKADEPQSYWGAPMSLYLAGIYAVFGYEPLFARIVMGILSTVVVGMIYLLARRLFDEEVALVAGFVAAGYAYLVFYGVTLVPETPFILAIICAVYVTYDIQESPSMLPWIALGLALAVAVLFRQAVMFFIPVMLACVAYSRRDRWYMAIVPLVIIILAVLPFTFRNYQLWGKFLLLQSQYGLDFWNGNHPDHCGDFHGKWFPIPEDVLAIENEVDRTDRLLIMGIGNVLNDPWHFIKLTITRLREFFKFWPTSDSTFTANLLRVFSFGILLPPALIGLIRNLGRWHRFLPVFLFMVVHTAPYAVTWVLIRYRIPVDVFLIIFAADAVVFIARKFSSRNAQPADAGQALRRF